ncbi:2'-5' RNA ligase family protein [Acinetobacter shaoyimingii]
MFLKPGMPVVASFDHDYPEWHKGRSDFSLWYLDILDPALSAYLQYLRDYFSDLLYTPNTRQFHITLFICGFLTQHIKQHDDDFTQIQFQQHLQDLAQARLPKFQLSTVNINSFESALFVEIEDQHNVLTLIRELLSKSTDEIAPLDYCPHITLGLYKNTVSSDEVFQRISTLKQQQFHLQIDHITFGSYQAQVLQGPLLSRHQFNLGTH